MLQRQVADREANGTILRINGARFPSRKMLEDFNPDYQPSLRRDVLAHLASVNFIPTADNVILLGPPGVGKTHLAIELGIKACQAGYPVLFDTAAGWVTRLTEAHHLHGGLDKELKRLRRYRLLIIDELGVPALRCRCGQPVLPARGLPLRTREPTDHIEPRLWTVGGIFTDDVVAAAMIDRLVHHAEVLTLDGESYRTRTRRELIEQNNINQK